MELGSKGNCVVCGQDLAYESYDGRFCTAECGWSAVFGGKARLARSKRFQ